MKRSSKKMIALMTTLAALAGQAAPVLACGGGGGYGGRVYSRPSVSYASPTYATSSYGYSPSSYGRPSYGYSNSNYHSSTVMQSQFGSVPQRVLSAAPQQQPGAQPSVMQPQQMQQVQQVQAQQRPSQPVQAQVTQTQATQGQAIQAQPVQSQAQNQPARPNNGAAISGGNQGNVAGGSQVAQNQTRPSGNNVAPAANSGAPAGSGAVTATEQSALQMLASIAAPAATPSGNQASSSTVPQFAPATPAHVGTWTATLPNNAVIQLQLGGDGKFSWTATQKGKASTFAGDYRVGGGRLTLVRSGDRQELKGVWSGDVQSGFNFKLDGAKDSGLDFQRT